MWCRGASFPLPDLTQLPVFVQGMSAIPFFIGNCSLVVNDLEFDHYEYHFPKHGAVSVFRQVLYLNREIHNEINIPIFMQDVFDTPISPEMAVELSNEHQNLKYLKVEVAPTLPRFNKLKEISNNSLPIPFGGMGGIFMIEEMRRGSVGTMPVCAIPEMFVKAYDLWDQGKHNEAEEYFHKYVPLIRTLGQGLGIWNWLPKYILKKKGIFSNAIAREPSLKPDNEQIYELDRMFDRLDL